MTNMEIFDLALLLLGAKVFGMIFNKFKQPSLVGELLAGIVLGSSVLGIVKPSIIVDVISQLGLIFLVLLTTLAIDWKKIESKAETYSLAEFMMASTIFVIIYFVGNFLGWSFYMTVVIAVALMQSSLAIASRTLININELNSPAGEAVIGFQVVDDIAAILSIAILANFLQNSSIGFEPIAKLIFIIVGFFVVMSRSGVKFISWFTNHVQKYGLEEALLGVTLVLALLLATFTEELGIASFLGVFLTGILLSKTSQAKVVSQKVKEVGEAFFIPIFFASIGLSVNILSAYQQIFFIIPFIAFVIIIKLFSSFLPFMIFRYSKNDALKIGSGMISLSEMALIILSIGMTSKVLDSVLYSVMIVSFVLIDVISPLITTFIFRRISVKSVRSYKRRFYGF